MRLLLACCLLVAVAPATEVLAARILAVLPLPGKSHFIYCQAMLEALAARGHHVTVYSPFTPSKPVANMKHIEIHTQHEIEMRDNNSFENFKAITVSKGYFGMDSSVVWHLTYTFCEQFLQHDKVKELLATKEKFDLVVSEYLFGGESMLIFGHIFKAPTVNLNGYGPWSIMNRVHGNALQIASHPDLVSFPFTDQMNFLERFRNFVSTVGTLYFYYNQHLPKHDAILQRVFKDTKMPPVAEMVTNMSLTLANFHPLTSYAQPLTPNIVPIGGVHIAEQPSPLPKDVKDFMDRGKNAVIYFSLGSVIPTHLMPPELLQTFVRAFTKLPYKILWKIEADSIPNLPANVMISKWLPQQSVLAHPNVVLFITHGGLLSQQEAFQAGVPVVGIPFFGDQPFNMRLYEKFGVGVSLPFLDITEQTFTQAVLSVAGKPQYIENAKKMSALFRHRPMSAKDTAVFWVEYVLRHGTVDHLRPAAANLPWYTLTLLDITAVLLASLLIVGVIIKQLCALLFSCCCARKGAQQVSSKKKKN